MLVLGTWELLKLICGRGGRNVLARAVALVRLLVILCCAILGIIIMSMSESI